MSETHNDSSAVTLKIPRKAMFAAGGVALVGVGLAAGMWLRNPSANTDTVAATDIPAIEQQSLAPTSAGSAPAEALVTGVSPAVAASAGNAPVAQHNTPKHSKHQSSNSGSANQAGDASTSDAPYTQQATPAPTCANCGVIESVRAVQQKGQGSGVGAVAGGVLGGLVGNQMGKGSGKTAMTVLGAIGGGLAGNEVEKQQKASTVYEVQVRMDDGSTRTFTQSTQPAVGARVEVDGKTLRPL
ncbi:MAG TPA: glycine zipper 2TM domain-containing protein [Aquabacterium sp.]|uniref:glycine zipper 2TM domain-containing protein n=1 Tax=Aquabacterium sp. TaxID=1872578 RepID=UPI002E3007EF|nr:glycine zipper 2TM domain-containing protein [Aquabacterium sp.]HEX5355055.1 glycine zipper 2TM domain-containing protein [Aquabacterium sp.]